MKILIFGLPGSGKTTLAKPFAELIGGVHLNADDVRKEYNDWDFTVEGRNRQASRMKYLADGVVKAGKIAIADFVCPTVMTRLEFNPDYTVWMDTISRCKYENTNDMFEPPEKVDYHVSEWFDNSHQQLTQVINRYMGKHYEF
jgi:adenylylsulfate kinase|tara:strand:- start:724 stop:1152 length:429 start_codon:yes stop_codon:yes gene_type:complete